MMRPVLPVVPIMPAVNYIQRQSKEVRTPPPIQSPSLDIQQNTNDQQQNQQTEMMNEMIRGINRKHEIMKEQLEGRSGIFPDQKQFNEDKFNEQLDDASKFEYFKDPVPVVPTIAQIGEQQNTEMQDKVIEVLKSSQRYRQKMAQENRDSLDRINNLQQENIDRLKHGLLPKFKSTENPHLTRQNSPTYVKSVDNPSTDQYKQIVQKSQESLLNQQPTMLISDDGSKFDGFNIFKDVQKDMQSIEKQTGDQNNKVFGFSDIDKILKSRFKIDQRNPFFPEFDSLPSLQFYQDLKKSDSLMYKGSFKTPIEIQVRVNEKIMKDNKNLEYVRTIYDDKFGVGSDKTKYILVQEYKDQNDSEQNKVFQILLSSVSSKDDINIENIKQVSNEQVQEIKEYKKQQVQIAQKIDQIVDKISKQALSKIENNENLVFSDFVSLDCVDQECEMIIKFKDQSVDTKINTQPGVYSYTLFSQNRYYSVKYKNTLPNPKVDSVTKLDKDDSKMIAFVPVGLY